MFIEFGFEMLNMLNGIFAFAIYNKISKKGVSWKRSIWS